MPKTTHQQWQRVLIRRHNQETPEMETAARLQISQTVAFAMCDGEVAPMYHAIWEFDAACNWPMKDDIITANDGTAWKVYRAVNVTQKNVRQCHAHAKITTFLPFETLHILRACAGMSSNGERMTTVWQRVQCNVSAKITTETIVTHGQSPSRKRDGNLRAYTMAHLSLQKNDLVELPDGRQCKILRIRNSSHMLGWCELFLTVNSRAIEVTESFLMKGLKADS